MLKMKLYFINREYISQLINQFPVILRDFKKVINIIFIEMCKTVFSHDEEIYLHNSSIMENDFLKINK